MPAVSDGGLLPDHGKIACTRCFTDGSPTWGRSTINRAGWQLENNPLAWGGRDPEVMVLGFSKGDRQCAVIRARGDLDAIPFAGMRQNLTRILQMLGLLGSSRTVDDLIRTRDPDFHFGSLVRCSLAKLDPVTKKPMKTGDVISAASVDPIGQGIVTTCAERFLSILPPRLRVVVFLSNADEWVELCFRIVKKLHPGTRRLNQIAYRSDRVTWLHVVHPSGSSGRHIPAWLGRSTGKQGEKGRMALEAVATATGADR